MKIQKQLDLLAWIVIAVVVLIVFLLQSCRPSLQSCNRFYPPKDSVSYIEKTKLDTTYIMLPGDTSFIKVQVPCSDFSASSGTGKDKIKVVVKDRILSVYAISAADSIRIVNACQDRQKYATKEIKIEVEKKVIPRWCWILTIFVVAYIGLKVSPIRRYIP